MINSTGGSNTVIFLSILPTGIAGIGIMSIGLDLKGRVALVTGGSRGIGAAIAVALALAAAVAVWVHLVSRSDAPWTRA